MLRQCRQRLNSFQPRVVREDPSGISRDAVIGRNLIRLMAGVGRFDERQELRTIAEELHLCGRVRVPRRAVQLRACGVQLLRKRHEIVDRSAGIQHQPRLQRFNMRMNRRDLASEDARADMLSTSTTSTSVLSS